MSDIKKQAAPFFLAWDIYSEELSAAYKRYTERDDKEQTYKPSSKKFESLSKIDTHFKSAIEPILKDFFDKNPLIHKAPEYPDISVYNKIENWWPSPYSIKAKSIKGFLPPRVTVYRRLESEKDVWDVLESKYPGGRNLEECLERMDGQREKELRLQFGAYFCHSNSSPGTITIGYLAPSKVPDLSKFLLGAGNTNLSEDGLPEETVWDVIQRTYSTDNFHKKKVLEQINACGEAVLALLDWKERLEEIKPRRVEVATKQASAPQAGGNAAATKPAEEKAQVSGIEQAAALNLIKTNTGNVKASVLKKGTKTSPLDRLPTIAISELIRATRGGLQDSKWIKERICQRESKWKKLVDEGKEPDLSHEEKAIKKAIKAVFGASYTPWNPLPFKIDIKDF